MLKWKGTCAFRDATDLEQKFIVDTLCTRLRKESWFLDILFLLAVVPALGLGFLYLHNNLAIDDLLLVILTVSCMFIAYISTILTRSIVSLRRLYVGKFTVCPCSIMSGVSPDYIVAEYDLGDFLVIRLGKIQYLLRR